MKYATYEENLNFVLGHNIKGLTAEETETIIINNKAEERASIETTDNSELTRLKKLLRANPAEWKLESYSVSGTDAEVLTSVAVSFPKGLITLRTTKRTIKFSEEQLAARSEKMRKMRLSQSSK